MTGKSLKWIARAGIRLAATVNPVTGGPAAPLRASALLDSFGPSLMPGKSLHQGIAGGLALLTANYSELSEEKRRALRAVVVDHDNDPISQMSLRLAVKRPSWLDGERRRNVPAAMRWCPLITFIQVVAGTMNAMVAIPGEFKSSGHDYRAETLDFVGAVYDLPGITGDRSRLVRETLVRRELDRARRIEAGEMDEIRISSEERAARFSSRYRTRPRTRGKRRGLCR